MAQRNANRRPLFMGASHSLRINKDYIGQAAIDWLNQQENANQVICRAVDFYYRYFEGGEYQERADISEAEIPSQNNRNQNSAEKSELPNLTHTPEDPMIDEVALKSLASMIKSVKR